MQETENIELFLVRSGFPDVSRHTPGCLGRLFADSKPAVVGLTL